MSVGRVSKIILVAAIALYMSLIALNNLTDYETNYAFVRHVLAMDTVPPESALHGRALPDGQVQRAFYGCIIAWEALTAVLCGCGAVRLALSLRSDGPRFQRAKSLAVAGLVLGLLLWLIAFLCVGGEWFAMWQSPTWNGQDAAFRMFAVTGIVLLYLTQPDPEL